jgi:hypothetical protein
MTQLSGYGGEIEIGKGSKGLWRYSTGLSWRSPGLDLNDIGYMQTADIIEQENSISYFVNQPVSIFRTYSIGFEQINNWDFNMNHLSSGGDINIYLEFLNNWAISTNVKFTSQALDTRILRGGYAMLVPAIWANTFYMRTDPSEKIYFSLNTEASISNNHSSQFYSIQPAISFMPIQTLKFTISINYSDNLNNLQYIDTKSVNGDYRYILGKIKQETISTTFRIDYYITPELSIQYYGSPFATVGKYSDFKSVTNPKAAEYNNRYSVLNPVVNGSNYDISENNNSHVDYSYEDPDFNFSQLRSNLVFRWEYRPGSQIYFVWSQDRTNYIKPGSNSVSNAICDLRDVYPNNIFLIKLSYWFSI